VSHEATPYPLDFELLQRGTIVSADELEEITGKKRETPQYQFAVMAIQQQARRHFMQATGEAVSVVIRQNALHVLEHAEQDQYVEETKRRALATFARRHAEDLCTDPSALSAEAQRRREHRTLLDSWRLQMLASEEPLEGGPPRQLPPKEGGEEGEGAAAPT